MNARPPAIATTGRGPSTGAVIDGAGVPRIDVDRRGPVGDRQHGGEVEVLRDLGAEPPYGRCRLRPLGGRHQAEVARRRGDLAVPRQHPEDREARRLQGGHDLCGVPRRARLVEDDPGQRYVGVEGVQPVDERRHGAGGVGDVDHEHDRGGQQSGHVGGGGEAVPADPTVEQPHHAFDDAEVGRTRAEHPVVEQRQQLVRRAQERVEVRPGRPVARVW